MKTTTMNANEIKFANFEISEMYEFNEVAMKSANFMCTGKESNFGSGKKSVLFGRLDLIDAEGKHTTFEYSKAENKGLDITTLKNKLFGKSATTQRNHRSAEQHEKLKKLYSDFRAIANEISDYLTEEDNVEDVENVVTYTSAFEQVIDKAVERLEQTSKAHKEQQAKVTEAIKTMSPEQLAQLLQLMQNQ